MQGHVGEKRGKYKASMEASRYLILQGNYYCMLALRCQSHHGFRFVSTFVLLLLLLLGYVAPLIDFQEKNIGKNINLSTSRTLIVGPEQNYTRIQDGIDNASYGDKIYVQNGTYYENLVLNTTVTIIGQDPNGTIIDGGGVGNVITVNRWKCKLINLSITNSGRNKFNAGIRIDSEEILIERCNCYGNLYGIFLHDNRMVYLHLKTEIKQCIVFSNDIGIYLYSRGDTNLDGNVCEKNRIGIYLFECAGIKIISCTCDQNLDTGIFLSFYCISNFIHCCKTNDNKKCGIYIEQSSHSNEIVDCICVRNRIGMGLTDSSRYNEITRCQMDNNTCYGIWIYDTYLSDYNKYDQINKLNNCSFNNNSFDGINIDYNNAYLIIENCTILGNLEHGLSLYSSRDIIIKDNLFLSNADFAIDLEQKNSKRIMVYGNIFIDNNIIGNGTNRSQVCDNGCLNAWNSTSGGNYWSDWRGPDENRDGFVDVPYNMDGSNRSMDFKPRSDWFKLDIDSDGYIDRIEDLVGTNKSDPTSKPSDLDNDTIPDAIDWDRDGDGCRNEDDYFPDDPNRWENPDNDKKLILIIVIVTILVIISVVLILLIVRIKIYSRRKKR